MIMNNERKVSVLLPIFMILLCSINGWEQWNPSRVEEAQTEAEVEYADIASEIQTLRKLRDDETELDNLILEDQEMELSETDPRVNKKRQGPNPAAGPEANAGIPNQKKCRSQKDCTDYERCEKIENIQGQYCIDMPVWKSADRTPAVQYSGTAIKYGDACHSTPTSIDDVQISNEEVDVKKIKLGTGAALPENFIEAVCNWRISRMECVANRPKEPPPTQAPPVTASGPEESAEEKKTGVLPDGTCKCILALGERSVYIEKSYKNRRGTEFGRCFIPANLGHSSKCGHDIVIPTGYIETGKRVYKNIGPAASYCAPGSVCRTGYNYVGLRCRCNKTFILDPEFGTCTAVSDDSGHSLIPSSLLLLILSLITVHEIHLWCRNNIIL